MKNRKITRHYLSFRLSRLKCSKMMKKTLKLILFFDRGFSKFPVKYNKFVSLAVFISFFFLQTFTSVPCWYIRPFIYIKKLDQAVSWNEAR